MVQAPAERRPDRTDDPFEIGRARVCPGPTRRSADPKPDAADQVDARRHDRRRTAEPEAGISGRSVRVGDRVFKALAAGSGAVCCWS